MTPPDSFFARLRKGDREAALFAFAVLASIAIAAFVAVSDRLKLASNARDTRIFGNQPARVEYHYARPDLLKVSVSAEWVVLTFTCTGDRIEFLGFENEGNVAVLHTTGTDGIRENVRSRSSGGPDLCHYRIARASTRLGDYLARKFDHRCIGSPCELRLEWDTVARSCTHPILLDDANWDSGVMRSRPDLALFPAIAMTRAGFRAGDELLIGGRSVRLVDIKTIGAYAHVSLGEPIAGRELRDAGWICRKVPA